MADGAIWFTEAGDWVKPGETIRASFCPSVRQDHHPHPEARIPTVRLGRRQSQHVVVSAN
jgi:hypothetical protein